MNKPAVVVDDVSKMFRIYHERNQSLKAALMRGRRAKYDEFWALKDVSLEIASGQTYGLVGHNGSGKSTLLKTMAKILRPDSGAVETNGKVSALLELGAGFHPELSGRDNVYLNGSILGLSKREIDAKFDDIVGFAGLEDFVDQPVKNYSSGMYVRLGFSIAINVDPEILMVDEILAVGDEEFQRRCMEKFKDFKDDGKTIIVVSHALGTVRTMCDEVAWLDHGRLVETGDPNIIIDKYTDVQVEKVAEAHQHDDDSADRQRTPGLLTLDGVELIGPDGEPTTTVRTGDEVRIRFDFEAKEDIRDDVVVAMWIHGSADGSNLTGPNTDDGGLPLRVSRGRGQVELTVPRLMLLPGVYEAGAAMTDPSRANHYDHKPGILRFTVQSGTPTERYGYFSLGGTWARTI